MNMQGGRLGSQSLSQSFPRPSLIINHTVSVDVKHHEGRLTMSVSVYSCLCVALCVSVLVTIITIIVGQAPVVANSVCSIL